MTKSSFYLIIPELIRFVRDVVQYAANVVKMWCAASVGSTVGLETVRLVDLAQHETFAILCKAALAPEDTIVAQVPVVV